MRRARAAGYAGILAAAVLWGTLGPAARLALREGVGALELSFWRAMLAGALYAAHAALRGRLRVAWRDVPGLLGFALLGVTLFYGSYFQAVRTGGAALAAILLYTAPAWVALASALWLGERLGGRGLAALALTLAGVALVALGGGGAGVSFGPAALGWGLLAGIAYAGYYLFGKRYFHRYPAPLLFMYALPMGGLALLPVVDFQAKNPPAWAALLFIALVPTYAAYLLYSYGLVRIEATRAATLATLEPVVAALLAYLAWGEVLGPVGYLGALLVLGGVVLAASEPRAAPAGP